MIWRDAKIGLSGTQYELLKKVLMHKIITYTIRSILLLLSVPQ